MVFVLSAQHRVEYKVKNSIDYNCTKLIKTVKKARYPDLAENIVIRKELPAMNRSQPEVNPVYQAFKTDRRIPTEIKIKQMAREREKYKLLDIIDYEEADAA